MGSTVIGKNRILAEYMETTIPTAETQNGDSIDRDKKYLEKAGTSAKRLACWDPGALFPEDPRVPNSRRTWTFFLDSGVPLHHSVHFAFVFCPTSSVWVINGPKRRTPLPRFLSVGENRDREIPGAVVGQGEA